MGLLIFLVFSRTVELTGTRPLPVMEFLLVAYGLLTSRWTDLISAKPTILLLALTALMVPAGLFGNWPGGSVDLLTKVWAPSLLFYFIVVSLGRGLAGVRTVMSSMAWSVVAVAIQGTYMSHSLGGRLQVGHVTLGNPNDLAAVLLFGLPFCAWYVLGSGRPLILRVVMAIMSAGALVMLLRTGSRMGLLAMLWLGATLLIIARGRLRLLLAVVALGTGVAAIFLLPEAHQQRYETMVDNHVEGAQNNPSAQTAIGSSQARWALFLHSLQVTAQHPLLGVGPGNFTGANADITRRTGPGVSWQVTHNSYTQVSSECGIPAAIIFIWLIYTCLRTTNRLRKDMEVRPELRVHAPMAFWIFISLSAYAFCAMFGCFVYGYQFPLLIAIAASLPGAAAGALAQPAGSPVPAGESLDRRPRPGDSRQRRSNPRGVGRV